MASQKPGHDFHLVNPSPWPIAASFALLGVTGGGVLHMHKMAYGGAIFGVSTLLLVLVAYLWWRDIVREGMVDKAHTKIVQRGLRVGMALFIASEVMFFAAFFGAYFNASLFPVLPLEELWPALERGVWPPKGIQTFNAWDIPFTNTLILLLSGTTVTWAHYALLNGDRKNLIRALFVTVVLGLLFTALQAYEYHHAAFGFKDGIYASTFYMATGFHGAHVIIGTIFLIVCLVRAVKNQFTPEAHLGFEFAAWYWHFVDVVWLFLFVSIYWFGGGQVPAAH